MEAHGYIVADGNALVWAASDTEEGATQAARAKLKRVGRNPDEVAQLRKLPATETLLALLAMGSQSVHWVIGSDGVACTPSEYQLALREADRARLTAG